MQDRTINVVEMELQRELHTHIMMGNDKDAFLRADMQHRKKLSDLRIELKNLNKINNQ